MQYIIKVNEKFDRSNPIFSKVGNPQTFTDTLIVSSDATLAEVRSQEGVESAIMDHPLSVEEALPPSSHWELKTLGGQGSGKGVNVYVPDSGYNVNHVEFKDKDISTLWSFDGVPSKADEPSADHGSACCALVLRTAPEATVYSIRVNFMTSGVLKALDIITQHHIQSDRNSVVSFSMSTPNDIFGEIIGRMINQGIVFIASAGNYSGDYPRFPAASPNVVSVGAIDQWHNIAYFSNGKSGGNMFFAPGKGLLVPYLASDTEYRQFDGTSGSTPLVAGIFANYLSGRAKISTNQDVINIQSEVKSNMVGTKVYPGQATIPRSTPPVKTPAPIIEPPKTEPIIEPPTSQPEPAITTPVQQQKKKDYTPYIIGGLTIIVILGVVIYNSMI